jgi:photosystem II stability/assembly factor-like uncharacterized protein
VISATARPSWAAAALVCAALASPVFADTDPAVDPALFQSLEFRQIGPFRGGRVTAVTGTSGDARTFYMGSTGGGVWKTQDSGVSWSNLSDGDLTAASIGALAVAPSDPNVLYAGTGSACPRGNISAGDGLYRSTDGGESWTHAGLEKAGQIGRIRVHPDNPDRVYVAVLGNLFGPSPERGVFRSEDGGATWEKVLFVSDRAGAVDLAMSPGNPRLLFAAIWQVERKPWTLESGGEESGLYRSKDGGDTWEKLEKGLPEGILGRIGVSVSGADARRVWALVEAEEGGLFRSDDGGESFRRINSDREFRQRAWYYTHVFADPVDRETVYIANTGLYRSTDGGTDFTYIRAPHGDHHDLWIDPRDPQVLINGNDGGANVSTNGGATWSSQATQPTAEIYRVTLDDQFPYRVYGCQQDNSCVSLPSRTASSGIARTDWWVIGGCESGHVAVDPRDPDVTYAGCYGGAIQRQDRRTGQEREITLSSQLAVGQATRDLTYRFQWNAPIRLSPHDPSVLYHTSQFVHRSLDGGQNWETISPDLTYNDTDKQGFSGGPITYDNTGTEVYGTVFAFEESPLVAGLLWAGTDDGRLHLSRDNGSEWQEITPPGVPKWATINAIALSPHGEGRAFLAVHNYRLNDFRPYVFRTDDFGAHWKLLTDGKNGIPANHFVRAVREDPVRKGLIWAGTEYGLYVSFDDGVRWQPFQQELPITPVTDIAIHGSDLVVSTQGRGFWILDDLTPLRALDAAVAAAPAWLYEPRPAYRFGGGSGFGGGGDAGSNPPTGVLIHYAFAEEPEAEVSLEILDASGEVLRKLSSEKEERQAPSVFRRFRPDAGESRKLAAKKGMNRYVWNFRLPDAEVEEDVVLWGSANGPRVPPGSYQVRLTAGDWSQTASFEVLADPRPEVAQRDLEAQYDLARTLWERLSESQRALHRLREVRSQAREIAGRMTEAGHGEAVSRAAEALADHLTEIEETLHQTQAESSQDVLNFPPRLDNQIVALLGDVQSADARPTASEERRAAELAGELDRLLAELHEALTRPLEELDELIAAEGLPAIIVPQH